MRENVYIIAELSANHGGEIDIAKKTIKAMKESGADAVKVQTYTADTITIDCDNDHFKIDWGTLWDGKSLYNLYEEAYMPWDWQPELKRYSDKIGIDFFSSPFDKTAVDFLEDLGVPCYKIASFEITDIPLIKYTASMGKPMIISTGIATEEEILNAVKNCHQVGNEDVTLLKCTSQYPAKIEDANLATMVDMKTRFGVKIGLSDHTMGSDVPVVAVALGATIVEKHFILDRGIGGPDASFSMIPSDFSEMVEKVRNVEKMLGAVDYSMTDSKKKSRHFARSLFVVENIKEGEAFTESNIRSIRPGTGLAPKELDRILSATANKSIKRGTPLALNMVNEHSDEN